MFCLLSSLQFCWPVPSFRLRLSTIIVGTTAITAASLRIIVQKRDDPALTGSFLFSGLEGIST